MKWCHVAEGETMTARPRFNVTFSKVIDALQGLCCHQQVVQPTQLSHQYHRNHKHVIIVIMFHKYSPGNFWLFDIGWGGLQKDVWIDYNTSADAKVNGLPLKHVTVCNIFVLKMDTNSPHYAHQGAFSVSTSRGRTHDCWVYGGIQSVGCWPPSRPEHFCQNSVSMHTHAQHSPKKKKKKKKSKGRQAGLTDMMTKCVQVATGKRN